MVDGTPAKWSLPVLPQHDDGHLLVLSDRLALTAQCVAHAWGERVALGGNVQGEVATGPTGLVAHRAYAAADARQR